MVDKPKPTLIIDAALAQIGTQQPTPQAPPPQYSADPVSAVAILLSSGVALFAIAPKLIEKWIGGAIKARQSKTDLQTLITKSQAELDLEEKRKELEIERAERLAVQQEQKRKSDIIENTLGTALANVYQSARESKEVYYLLLQEIQDNNKITEKGYEDIARRLDLQDERHKVTIKALQDIFAVLEMRRGIPS